MITLTPQGAKSVDAMAERFHFSREAVLTVFESITASQGSSAQFRHPDLGGSGQWMRGGMTQIGDMFNDDLKARVRDLCDALAGQWEDLIAPPTAQPSDDKAAHAASARQDGTWWPKEFGSPSTSGAQNSSRYAFFPDTHRLAIETNGVLVTYDTGDQIIEGVAQQQGGDRSGLAFTGPHGAIDPAHLPKVDATAVPG